MSDTADRNASRPAGYDAVIVGASLAGCAAAILLGRAGARVAVLEKQPDPRAFKRMCSHFIQASAVPSIERLGMLEPIEAAGGVRSRFQAWTRWGWIRPPLERAAVSLNVRREVLDPMLREKAAMTPGVEMRLGQAVHGLIRDGAEVAGVIARDRDGGEQRLRARLTIGADGRDSKVAELSEIGEKVLPHGRFAYGGYFEGATPDFAPDASIWMLDPNWAAAFPTDSCLTFYAAMATKDLLPEFKRDPEGALVEYVSSVPEPPPIREARLVGDVLGKIEMPNRVRVTTAPGLALVGDAAQAVDPLFGIGCGWALQSSEWLADSVVPALRGDEPLERGLKRYRRLHKRRLGGHTLMVNDYASGRPMNRGEKTIFAAAARDPKVAANFDAFGTRQIGPARMFATTVPRALAVNLRYSRRRRREDVPIADDGQARAAVR
ncbi:MAG TPA: NAD(P)/FAD-dependent oxidoreductase [Solirubrobacterales bacterium]|nr:NAD(P)/FAD-dependent oxidoreductase [Solirubrobacterales bacterium]